MPKRRYKNRYLSLLAPTSQPLDIKTWPAQLDNQLRVLEGALSPEQKQIARDSAEEYATYNLKFAEFTTYLNNEYSKLQLNAIHERAAKMKGFYVPANPAGQIEAIKRFLNEMPTETPEHKAKWCRMLLILGRLEQNEIEMHWPMEVAFYKQLLAKKLCAPRLQELAQLADHPQETPPPRSPTVSVTQQFPQLVRPTEPFRTVPVDIQKYLRSDFGILDDVLIFGKLFFVKPFGADNAYFTVHGAWHSPSNGRLFSVQWEGSDIVENKKESDLRQLLQISFEVQAC